MHKMLRMIARLTGIVLLAYGTTSHAEESASDNGRLTLFFAPYVYHTSYDPNHNDYPWMTGLEWEPRESKLEFGAAYFKNSFGQDSVYAYVGKRWFFSEQMQGVFVNLTGGPLYGYRGQYENKVPFNHNGLGVAIIPAIGYQYRSVSTQLVILGTAGLLATFAYDFW